MLLPPNQLQRSIIESVCRKEMILTKSLIISYINSSIFYLINEKAMMIFLWPLNNVDLG